MSLLLLFGQAAAVTYTKTGAVTAGTKLAGADVHEAAETGAFTTATRLVGADVFAASENGAVFTGALLRGSAQAGFISKLGTAATAATSSGADAYTATETGVVAADTTVAATWAYGFTAKTGTVAAGALASGADVYTATETGAVKATARLSGFVVPPALPTGKFVLTNARIVLNGTDISRLANSVTMNLETDEFDYTPLGSTYRLVEPGPMHGEFQLDLFADQTILTPAFWASLDSGVPIEISPRNFPTAVDNPTWTATAIAVRKTPLTGDVGEAATASVELHSTGPVLQNTS